MDVLKRDGSVVGRCISVDCFQTIISIQVFILTTYIFFYGAPFSLVPLFRWCPIFVDAPFFVGTPKKPSKLTVYFLWCPIFVGAPFSGKMGHP